jgi:DNA-binding Lrp family transcriptional regulator
MTQDEIIEMARQAGFFVKDSEAYSPSVQEDHELTPYLEAFAKLVAEHEREACAAICDALHEARVGKDNYFAFAANAIRELRAKQ